MENEMIVTPEVETSLAVKRTLTAAEIKAQVQRIQEVMRAVMQDKVHYGIVPGCGDKPTLLKPGAEKLLVTFRIAPDAVIEDLSNPNEARYRVVTKATSIITGEYLGFGVGECSSDEEKYKWRKAVCNEEWDEAQEDRKRQKWFKSWDGKPAYQGKQIRTNKADIANTVLKMAKKRALVDLALTVTAASDIFTQDFDEMEPEVAESIGTPTNGNGKPAPAMPARKSETQPQQPAKPKAAVDRSQMKSMHAKFKSKCNECNGEIAEGEQICYDGTTKKAYHVECPYTPE